MRRLHRHHQDMAVRDIRLPPSQLLGTLSLIPGFGEETKPESDPLLPRAAYQPRHAHATYHSLYSPYTRLPLTQISLDRISACSIPMSRALPLREVPQGPLVALVS